MQKLPSGSWRFSATDLIHFLDCEHLISLDRTHAETPLNPVEDDAMQHSSRLRALSTKTLATLLVQCFSVSHFLPAPNTLNPRQWLASDGGHRSARSRYASPGPTETE